ncbi:MAG: S24 family peptidase [Rikenellaceae bacterium]
MVLTAGQRIEKVVKWAGLSVHAFAISIGLKRSENLYQIKKGNNNISANLADIIVSRYSDISKSWLLTGEGEMLRSDSNSAHSAIPYYAQDAVSLINSNFEFTPQSSINIGFYKDVEFAAAYMSDSMADDIPMGAVMLCQSVEPKDIILGASYLISVNNFVGVRYVRSAEESKLRLVAANNQKYDQMIIDTSQINKLYLVKGIIVNKSI